MLTRWFIYCEFMEILSKDLLGSGVSGDVFSFGERMARYHEITV